MSSLKPLAVPLVMLAALVIGFFLLPGRPASGGGGNVADLASRVVSDVRSENERREALYRWSHDSLSRAIAALQDTIRVRQSSNGYGSMERNQRLIIVRLSRVESEVDLLLERQKRILCWASNGRDVLCR